MNTSFIHLDSILRIFHFFFTTISNENLRGTSKRTIFFLPPNTAFRKGRNTLQALTDLHPQINEATHANSTLYTIFFDRQQAFPRVWRHYICQRVMRRLADHIVNVIRNFLGEPKNKDHVSCFSTWREGMARNFSKSQSLAYCCKLTGRV